MSFLNAVINKVEDVELRERLQERVDIVQHKIKFMEQVTIACLDVENNLSNELSGLIEDAGGVLQSDVHQARVVIYCQKNVGILQLMGIVPSLLNEKWPSVEFNRIYLWDEQASAVPNAENAVDALEDLVEMFYPGYFVFGNEGKTWVSFKTQ